MTRPRRKVDEVRQQILRDFILNGDIAEDGYLPSEAQLTERYGVSRVTLRAAIRGLEDAGLVEAQQGLGTRVKPRSRALTHGLDRLCTLETFAREEGRIVTTEDLAWEVRPADEELATHLGLSIGDDVVVVRRAKVWEGIRINWSFDCVPADLVTADELRHGFETSILDILLARTDLGVDYADTEITPVSLSGEPAKRLKVKPRTVALHVDLHVYTRAGRVIDWAESWLLPEYFHFLVRRRVW